MEKIKKQVKETYDTGKTIVQNAEELILAISLVIVAAYNYYDLTIRAVGNVEYTVRLAASVIIALKGAIAVVQFFNKKNKK